MPTRPRITRVNTVAASLAILIVWLVADCTFPRRSVAEPATASLSDVPVRVRQTRPLVTSAFLSPRLSPTGASLAYLNAVVDETGESRRDLWVTDLQSMRSQHLTASSVCFDMAWSADGTWLAVAVQRPRLDPPRAGLYLMRADATATRELFSTASENVPTSLAWQPGQPNRIAFISSMERPAGSNPLHRHLIWLFDTAATEAEALTCFSFPEHLSLSPRSGLTWSSDGTGIYFLGVEEADSPKTAIWFLSVPGGSARKVLDEPENSRFASLCAAPPAPGGTAVPRQVLALLLLPKRGTESAANVCLLLPEDDRFRSLVPTVLLPQELRIDYTSSISWDGACRRLAYVRDRDIWLIELATPSEAATLDCQDNLAALYKAFTQYAGQHGGLLPSPEQDTEGKWRQGDFFWVDALAPFIEQQSVLECSSRETLPSSYSFNRDLWGKSLADVSATRDVPLLTETQPSHGGRRNVLTPDGQIRLQAG